jgi:hypothetical protein
LCLSFSRPFPSRWKLTTPASWSCSKAPKVKLSSSPHILEEIEESAILQVTKPKAEQVNGSRASSTPIEGDTVPQV